MDNYGIYMRILGIRSPFIKRTCFTAITEIINCNTLSFQISSARLRYLVVSVGNTTVSHSEAQAVCEQIGAGLATVLTDADYVALNTTVHQSGVPDICNKRKTYMGATSSGNFTWQWRTGDPVSTNWAYWSSGRPYFSSIACMRALVFPGVPVSFADYVCDNVGFNCILCDA